MSVHFSEVELTTDGERDIVRIRASDGAAHGIADADYEEWRNNPLKIERAMKDLAYANMKLVR